MDSPRTGTAREERVVAGRYTLLAPLGSGGMGTVWRARDAVLGRDVAVKEVVFPPGVSAEDREVLRERTRREARAAAGLHHPSAVTVYDVVEHDGAPFLVMELVEAATLADVVRTRGPLAPQRAAQVGLAVLDALVAAHRQGILHRDVKPSNVLVCDSDDPTADGRVVLTDFGIATSAGDASITSTGLVLGSPNYIAPERARGRRPGPESDLWSLGATLYAAVEGRPPYDAGGVLATVTAIALGEPPAFTSAGPLEDVVRGLLEPDPERRLDAQTARRRLQQVAGGPVTATAPAPVADTAVVDRTAVLPVGAVRREVDDAPPAPAAPRPVRPSPAPARRSRALPLVLTALLLLGTVLGVAALLTGGDDRGTAPPAAPAPEAAAEPTTDAGAALGEPPAVEGEPEPERDAGQGPVPPPEGWAAYTGGPGWQIAVPPSYAPGSFRGDPEYRDPGTGRTVRVSTTGPGGGKDDAAQDRREQAASFADRYPSYEEIDISGIDYRGYEAADWEFTYTPGDVPLHVLSRVFVVDGRGYSLFFQSPAGDDWDAARDEFERISRSFVPA